LIDSDLASVHLFVLSHYSPKVY